MSDDIVAKILALLAKTEAAGCTAEESASAMQAASKLMAKHNIDQVVVENAEAAKFMRERRRVEIVEIRHKTGRDKCWTDEYTWRILEACFGVRLFSSWSYERKTVTHKDRHEWKTPDYAKRRMFFVIGDKTDAELAAAMIAEFRRIMRHLVFKHCKDRGITWNAVTAHSFCRGFCSAYIGANKVAKEEAMLEAGATAADQYALAVVDKEKATEDYIAENIVTVRARRSHKKSDYDFDVDAFQTGDSEGGKLNLKGARLK